MNSRLQRVPVVAGSLVQQTFKGGSELVLRRREFQLVGVLKVVSRLSVLGVCAWAEYAALSWRL